MQTIEKHHVVSKFYEYADLCAECKEIMADRALQYIRDIATGYTPQGILGVPMVTETAKREAQLIIESLKLG